MKTFEYYINIDERGEFNADVRDCNGNTVWETDGDVISDGFMSDKYDMGGLRDYLESLGVIGKYDSLILGE